VRLPVINDKGRIRWATIPDDCVGALDYPRPLREIIQRRAEVTVAIFAATHGIQKAFTVIRNNFRIQKNEMVQIMATGTGRPAILESAEIAFAAAVGRVRLIDQQQNGGRHKKTKSNERIDACAGDSAGGTGSDDETTTLEAPTLPPGDVHELRQGSEIRAESNSVFGLPGDAEGEDAPAHWRGTSELEERQL
jgi:hypothetical protein